MQTSDTVAKVGAAMAKAQGAFGPVLKNTKNPHLGNKYADLASVLEAVRPVLAANGIAVIQGIEDDADSPQLATLLVHQSGEWIRTYTPVVGGLGNKGVNDAQAFGMAQTYARRYGLLAALGVAPEDDDGNSAGNRAAPRGRERGQQGPRGGARGPQRSNGGQGGHSGGRGPQGPSRGPQGASRDDRRNAMIAAVMGPPPTLQPTKRDIGLDQFADECRKANIDPAALDEWLCEVDPSRKPLEAPDAGFSRGGWGRKVTFCAALRPVVAEVARQAAKTPGEPETITRQGCYALSAELHKVAPGNSLIGDLENLEFGPKLGKAVKSAVEVLIEAQHGSGR